METSNEQLPDRTHEVQWYPNAYAGFRGGKGLFVWRGKYDDRALPRLAGFDCQSDMSWTTASPAVAYRLAPGHPVLGEFKERLASSYAEESDFYVPLPEGKELYPYQRAGVEYAHRLQVAYIADEMGLGKTPQAIGLANVIGAKRVLVICPAHLRVNWMREILSWSIGNPVAQIVRGFKDTIEHDPDRARFLIVSYEFATKHTELLRAYGRFDLLVVDEAHCLKGATAKRSKAILGTQFQEPLTNAADKILFLSGTPAPNRASELWPVLRATAPHLIADCKHFEQFQERYAFVWSYGYERMERGSKNESELGLRLRGGFLIRRLKDNVLKQLPKKQFKMVVFPPDGQTKKVLSKEKKFSVSEILTSGVPAGSPLAEVRREMGEAKLPVAVKYISELLDDGLRKVVVFAHHRSVVEGLHEGLKGYGSVMVIGGLSDTARQQAVDSFQADDATRVIVANIQAGGTGLNLTAADVLIRVESSWVDGENAQAEDRICRIGQESDSLYIHDLVVEGSLDAMILGCSTKKGSNVSKILNKDLV